MPAMRKYTVTQTRQVEVSANTPVDAVRIAGMAFDGKPTESTIDTEVELGVWGHTHGKPLPVGMTVEEKRY